MPSAIPPIQGEGLPVAVNDAPTKGHPSTVKETGLASSSRASSSDDENLDKTSKNPFADPVIAAHWRSVYEKAQYESRHVLDEELEWTEKEEKRIVRKLDFRVCLWAVSSPPLSIRHRRDLQG